MSKLIFNIFFLFLILNVFSQEKAIDSTNVKNNWNKSGNFTFLGNQSSYSYWTAGGQTSISGTIKIDYDFNFENNGWNWDTKVITAYGLNSIGGSKYLKKTDDRFEINSLLGKKFTNNLIGNWSYSSFINFKTQWTKGYRYRKNSNGEEERSELTRFFSPAYLQIGIGLYWRKSKDLWVNFAPVTGRLIIVNKFFTENLQDGKQYFGVNKGSNSRFELGASLRSYFKFEFIENVEISNRLSLYSDYLENSGNIDLDYTINTSMKINKHLTTNLILQFIYDDNSVKRLQVREVMGIGLNLKI
tara:strand:- start:2326 stop:3228 length:903 start_codon:yes stop_codon:yes gene_type:complete